MNKTQKLHMSEVFVFGMSLIAISVGLLIHIVCFLVAIFVGWEAVSQSQNWISFLFTAIVASETFLVFGVMGAWQFRTFVLELHAQGHLIPRKREIILPYGKSGGDKDSLIGVGMFRDERPRLQPIPVKGSNR